MLNAIAALLAVSAAGALDEGDFWTGVSRSTDERLNRTRELARRGYKEAGQGSSELSISADRGRAGRICARSGSASGSSDGPL